MSRVPTCLIAALTLVAGFFVAQVDRRPRARRSRARRRCRLVRVAVARCWLSRGSPRSSSRGSSASSPRTCSLRTSGRGRRCFSSPRCSAWSPGRSSTGALPWRPLRDEARVLRARDPGRRPGGRRVAGCRREDRRPQPRGDVRRPRRERRGHGGRAGRADAPRDGAGNLAAVDAGPFRARGGGRRGGRPARRARLARGLDRARHAGRPGSGRWCRSTRPGSPGSPPPARGPPTRPRCSSTATTSPPGSRSRPPHGRSACRCCSTAAAGSRASSSCSP